MAENPIRPFKELIKIIRRKNPQPETRTTVDLQKRLKHNPMYEEPEPGREYGTFADRPIIGRDSPINGGVYLGGGKREAIVVDESKDTELSRAYEWLKQNLINSNLENLNTLEMLNIIVRHVNQELPYDESVEDRLVDFHGDERVTLGSFITIHAGVCRHQALLTAYFLEKINQDPEIQQHKLMAGKVSVDRKHLKDPQGKDLGGHAWVRYWDRMGGPKIYIIDPGAHITADIETANQIASGEWDYRRPEDLLEAS